MGIVRNAPCNCTVHPYPLLPIHGNAALVDVLLQVLHQILGPQSKRHLALVICGGVVFPYRIGYADSHLEARGAALEAHARLGRLAPGIVNVVGSCRELDCTCGNTLFAVYSERSTPRSPWRCSERRLLQTGELRADLSALLGPNLVENTLFRKHAPLWRSGEFPQGQKDEWVTR